MRAVREQQRGVSVERVEETAARAPRIADERSGAERDAEAKAGQALSAQRDWQPDLRGVTVHDDDAARRSADAIGAAAFTRGSDIYVGSEYEAGTPHGDHVLAHELAHVAQQHGPDDIHRFPATAFASTVDWKKLTGGVFRPGEGVSGGVYILSDKDPDSEVPKIVVKPVFGETGEGVKETGEQLSFGDQALAMLGVKTPVSRVARGGELDELIALCKPHQPARPTDPTLAEIWRPIDEAESFVVMGEVPNAKGSLGGLAEKAATDPAKMGDLMMALLDDDFMFQFGAMCVGDMLVGNMDRLNGKKTNLGNIMVSVVDGKVSPWAIDTTASLGKFDPSAVAKEGGTALSGFASVKDSFKLGPDGLLRLVYNNIKYRLEENQGPAPTDGSLAPDAIFDAEWKKNLPKMTQAFNRGWMDALGQIYQLVNTSEGRGQMKSLVDQQKGTEGEDELQYQALKTNAMYLGSKALDGTHEEAGAQAGGYAAYKKFQSFDAKKVVLPVDEFFYDRAPVPPSAAFSAEWEQPPSLPAPTAMNLKLSDSYKDPELHQLGLALDNARFEVSKLGDKGKGKNKQPRNRVMAADFVINSFSIGAGAYRAGAAAFTAASLIGDMELIAGGGLKPTQVASTLGTARFAKNYLSQIESTLDGYNAALGKAAGAVTKIKRYPQAAGVAGQLNAAAKQVTRAKSVGLGAAQKKKPDEIYDALVAAAKKSG